MQKFSNYFTAVLVFLGFGVFYLWHYQHVLYTQKDILQVSFLDIGQGDAIYIRAPNGVTALIDGGPDDAVLAQLEKEKVPFDQTIDVMMETHPDKDHIAGLPEVFERYAVKNFIHSEISSGTSFDEALKKSASTEPDLKEIIARRGQRIILDKSRGVYLDILFPDQNTADFAETNNASIVARLVFGEKSFLLNGDSPISVEQFLSRNDVTSLRSTVLKLGHHGSNTSTSDEFLDQVNPEYAVVSAGKNNSYHHPAQNVVARVLTRNIKLLSTIESGTVTFETDGKNLWTK